MARSLGSLLWTASLNSGRYFSTGSSHCRRPSSTSIPTSVAVNALVADPMKNGVFGVTGVFFSTSATPNPLAKITSSPRTIASAAPGTCRSIRLRSISAARRSSRSASVGAVFCGATDCAAAGVGDRRRTAANSNRPETRRGHTCSVMGRNPFNLFCSLCSCYSRLTGARTAIPCTPPVSSRVANAAVRPGRQHADHERQQRRRQHPDRVRRGHSGQRHTRRAQHRQPCRPECRRDQRRRRTPDAASAAAPRTRARGDSRREHDRCRGHPGRRPEDRAERDLQSDSSVVRPAPAGPARDHRAATAIPRCSGGGDSVPRALRAPRTTPP